MSELRRTPIRPVSKKRARENRVRRANVLAAFGSNPACEARIANLCTHAAQDAHERLTRGRGGSIVDVTNIVPVCRACHMWIGSNPQEALELGLVSRR